MKIVCISDTHGQHHKLEVPDGDVLIFAGDMEANNLHYVSEFNEWLGTLPHEHKVVIAGNHDWMFQSRHEDAVTLMTNATYLQDSGLWIGNYKFYGSPWTPTFREWAFMRDRGIAIWERWNLIPKDTDVLITHGPALRVLDQPLPARQDNCGCMDLARAVSSIQPKLHVFGHIHGSSGIFHGPHTISVNASVLDEGYRLRNPARVVTLP